MNACKEYDLPESVVAEEQGGISVTFLKNIYSLEYLKSFHLSDRQTKAALYIRENEEIELRTQYIRPLIKSAKW